MDAPKYDYRAAETQQRETNTKLHREAIEAVRAALKWQETQTSLPDGELLMLRPYKGIKFLRTNEDRNVAGKYNTEAYFVARLSLYAISEDGRTLLEAPEGSLYEVDETGKDLGLLKAEQLGWSYDFSFWRWEMVHRAATVGFSDWTSLERFTFEEPAEDDPDARQDFYDMLEEQEAVDRERYGS